MITNQLFRKELYSSKVMKMDLSNFEPKHISTYIDKAKNQFQDCYFVGGYGEVRGIYHGGKNAYVHTGMDIMLDEGEDILAPFDLEIIYKGLETKESALGGYVVFKANINGEVLIFSFLHLDYESLTNETKLKKGEVIGKIASHENNGGWGSHLHINVMNQKHEQFNEILEWQKPLPNGIAEVTPESIEENLSKLGYVNPNEIFHLYDKNTQVVNLLDWLNAL